MAQKLIKLPNQRTQYLWDAYLATAYAEGFCEGENATLTEQLEAWACLIVTGMAWSLQGFFGRTANNFIERGIIAKDGTINWDEVDRVMDVD